MNKYVFKSYDSNLPQLFDKEKQRIEGFLTLENQVEHVGSTSIPGLGGKGIIDIYIAVVKDSIEQAKNELQKAGYEYRDEASKHHNHAFFKRIENDQVYHLHLNYFGQEDWNNALIFRDFLRQNPKDVEDYAKIKQKAADEANEDRDKYMAIKSPIMGEILKKATNR